MAHGLISKDRLIKDLEEEAALLGFGSFSAARAMREAADILRTCYVAPEDREIVGAILNDLAVRRDRGLRVPRFPWEWGGIVADTVAPKALISRSNSHCRKRFMAAALTAIEAALMIEPVTRGTDEAPGTPRPDSEPAAAKAAEAAEAEVITAPSDAVELSDAALKPGIDTAFAQAQAAFAEAVEREIRALRSAHLTILLT